MKTLTAMLAAAAIAALSSGTAFAECVDTSDAGTDANKTAAISKDGARAQLESDARSADSADAAAKDGNTMPLAEREGGGDKDRATSQQDVEAQQQGDQTAAAQVDRHACAE